MLDLKHKSLCLVFSFIGHEQDKTIVEEYDKRFFLTNLVLKCHQLLRPLIKSNSLTSQTNNEDSNIDIFKLIASAHELTKELVNM
jgi:hypothetical protein